MDRLQGFLGMAVLLGIAFLLSNNRARINWKTIIIGVGLQIMLGVVLLKMGPVSRAFRLLAAKVEEFLRMSDQGANFVFGPLVDSVMLSKLIVSAQNNEWVQQVDFTGAELGMGFVFAFKVLPTIIFFSAFISVMYYLGVIQHLIRGVAWMMRKTMGTSGSETLSCSGNIFVGQTEGSLLIRPYLGKMTQSELCTVMCGGFATIAGGVMAGVWMKNP